MIYQQAAPEQLVPSSPQAQVIPPLNLQFAHHHVPSLEIPARANAPTPSPLSPLLAKNLSKSSPESESRWCI